MSSADTYTRHGGSFLIAAEIYAIIRLLVPVRNGDEMPGLEFFMVLQV